MIKRTLRMVHTVPKRSKYGLH